MKILIEGRNASYNWGDASMLHVAIRRLLRAHPEATITLLDDRSLDVADSYGHRVCKGSPDIKMEWHNQRPIWNRLDDIAPHTIDRIQTYLPRAHQALVTAKMSLLGRDVSATKSFPYMFEEADLLLVAGGGFMTDDFAAAEHILNTILLAKSRNVPIAMVGQGIGPFKSARLRERVQFTLSHVDIIALREKQFSLPLLQELGIDNRRIHVTGDDAVSLAHTERPESLGNGIGVNLRVAHYSKVNERVIDRMGTVLAELGHELNAPLHPIPISYRGKRSDVYTIQRILDAAERASDGGASVDNVESLIQQTGRCRVVVTGSYHAGVFALSQGIPVVALAASQYYENKFLGLADMFDTGCTLLRTDDNSFAAKLAATIRKGWQQAPVLHEPLVEAARLQIKRSKRAYAKISDLLTESLRASARPAS